MYSGDKNESLYPDSIHEHIWKVLLGISTSSKYIYIYSAPVYVSKCQASSTQYGHSSLSTYE